MTRLRIGTAGWAIPRAAAAAFPAEGSSLERYASRFDAVEINSTFHRPHRPGTFARWAESVPDRFRFAVKLPKAITHRQRLVECDAMLARFAAEIAPLGEKRGPALVQLPPSLAFERATAERFFAAAEQALLGPIVCEPRHASWFTAEVDALLSAWRVARVAADPSLCPAAAARGGWRGLAYFRLHGSPRIYWSSYDGDALGRWAGRVAEARGEAAECWVILDNTAGGAAIGNALELTARAAGAGAA
jgi:uncharacterized protein YecE (DUF72 family)